MVKGAHTAEVVEGGRKEKHILVHKGLDKKAFFLSAR
jgi:hypothetical protein